MNLPTVVALVVLGAGVAFVVFTQVMRKTRAEISVAVTNGPDFRAGDRIEGSVTLSAKEPREVESAEVTLECLDRGDNADAGGSHRLALFRETVTLASDARLTPGAPSSYRFVVDVPVQVEDGIALDGVQGAGLPGAGKAGPAKAVEWTGLRMSTPLWQVTARARVDNYDVTDTTGIEILD